jgi:hypothetical protein
MCRRVVLVGTEVSEERIASIFGVKSLKELRHKQTPWPLVRNRNIPTERPPLVHEV